jgi:hypothetical protein
MKSLDILVEFSKPKSGCKSQFPRASQKKRVIVGGGYENGRDTDHTMKDTSRQNRTPLSGLGRSGKRKVGMMIRNRSNISARKQEIRRTS